MKGVVFTELIELVENQMGLEVADAMIEKSGVPNHGAYTAVGSYDYHEVLQLVVALSEVTQIPASDLVRTFGRHLFGKFTAACPHFVHGIHNTVELLPHVERFIHVEVRKLDPHAELPAFDCQMDEHGALTVIYRSSRPFADLAEGLIGASIDHFHDAYTLSREDLEARDGRVARFTLQPAQVCA